MRRVSLASDSFSSTVSTEQSHTLCIRMAVQSIPLGDMICFLSVHFFGVCGFLLVLVCTSTLSTCFCDNLPVPSFLPLPVTLCLSFASAFSWLHLLFSLPFLQALPGFPHLSRLYFLVFLQPYRQPQEYMAGEMWIACN